MGEPTEKAEAASVDGNDRGAVLETRLTARRVVEECKRLEAELPKGVKVTFRELAPQMRKCIEALIAERDALAKESAELRAAHTGLQEYHIAFREKHGLSPIPELDPSAFFDATQPEDSDEPE